MNNGWKSNPFIQSRGLRQGCSISALLFILIAEILALNIRHNQNFKGIKIKLRNSTKQIKICQLADDTTIFIQNKQEINNVLKIIENYGQFSGLKLNKNKTEALWVGKNKHSREKIGDISWPTDPIKALGVYFGTNKTLTSELNLKSKIDACKKLINNWKKRKLTIFGRTQIIKTLIIPKFTYIAQSYFIPKNYMKEINTIIYTYLWEGKREKISRSTLNGKISNGGLNLFDIETFFNAQKIKWVKALLEPNIATWKIIPQFYLENYGKQILIFSMNIENINNLNEIEKLPDFYRDLLKFWLKINKVKTKDCTHSNDIKKQIIFGNKSIIWKNKLLIYHNWIDEGIIFINDIIDKNGIIDKNKIYNKLKITTNWFSEITTLIKAIPNTWKNALQSNI